MIQGIVALLLVMRRILVYDSSAIHNNVNEEKNDNKANNCIATRVPPRPSTKNTSIPEVCGDAAIYFDEDDHHDLLTKIELLFNSEKVYETYRDRGLSHAQKYNWDTSLKNIEQLIKKL